MSQVSRRTFVHAGAALCVVPVFSESAAQAAYEGPGPIELGTGATHVQLLRVRRTVSYRRAILHLEVLVARTGPGAFYDIHLNRSHAIGAITFGTAPSHRSFDVSTLLPLDDRIVVSLVSRGVAVPCAAPRIGRLSLRLA